MKTNFLFLSLLALLGACTPDKPVEQPPAGPAPTAPPPAPITSAPADTLSAYEWDTEACHYTGYYNPRRYSKQELDNTSQLLYSSVMLSTDATANNPADIDKLSVDSLTAEYNRQIRHYRQLRVVSQPVWLALKQQAIQEIEDEYRAKKLTLEAFHEPAVLLTATHRGNCSRYVLGLAAHDDSLTLRDWRQLIEERKVLNGAPESYMRRFQEEYNSADRLLYAKIELLTYGWWNCLNDAIRRTERTEKMYRQFPQLFVRVKSECEDVD